MKVYTGIDIIEVERVKQNIEKHGNNFLNKVYTQKEIEYCESKKSQKYQSYAARFAGKEAVFKAISKQLKNKFEIGWQDIEILNDENGRPFVNLNINEHASENMLIALQNLQIDISLSHIKTTAIASVAIIEE